MRVWVGGYTADAAGAATGIGVVRAGAPDSPLAGGDLAFAGVAASALSPSWVASHPTLDVVYAAQEHAGTVRAFARTGEESFVPLGPPVDAGEAVCHVAVSPDGRSLVASCWGDGRVVHYPLLPDGRLGAARIAKGAKDPYALPGIDELDATLLLFVGGVSGDPTPSSGALLAPPRPDAVPKPARSSRAHQAVFLPGGFVATTDLGLDVVRFWATEDAGLRWAQDVVLPQGTGPRHVVWHPSGHVYVVTELSLEVFVLAPQPSAPPRARWRLVGGTSLGPGAHAGAGAAAEIALTRDAQYAIIGIRGINALASLRVTEGGRALVPVALTDAGVDGPRHHIVARDTVLVAGQLSQEVVGLALDERSGAIGRVRRRVEVPSPTCLLPART